MKSIRSSVSGEPTCPKCGVVWTDTGYYEDGQRCHDPRPPVSEEPHRLCDAPLTDFVIDAGTCQRPIGHSGIHWFKGDPSGEPSTDYERGSRSVPAIAVQIDRTLNRLLREDADREELWPLIYEYGHAAEARATPPSRTLREAIEAGWHGPGQCEARAVESTPPSMDAREVIQEWWNVMAEMDHDVGIQLANPVYRDAAFNDLASRLTSKERR